MNQVDSLLRWLASHFSKMYSRCGVLRACSSNSRPENSSLTQKNRRGMCRAQICCIFWTLRMWFGNVIFVGVLKMFGGSPDFFFMTIISYSNHHFESVTWLSCSFGAFPNEYVIPASSNVCKIIAFSGIIAGFRTDFAFFSCCIRLPVLKRRKNPTKRRKNRTKRRKKSRTPNVETETAKKTGNSENLDNRR